MKKFLVLFSVLFSLFAHAQFKPNLFQKQSMPTMEYTSLAGWHGGLQVNTAYQNFYPGIRATNVDYALNVDYYSPKLKGAFGVNTFHSRLGTGTLLTNNIDLYYTQRIKAGEFTISPSASLSYRLISIDWNQVTFGELINDPSNFYYNGDLALYSNANKIIPHVGVSVVHKSLYGALQVSNITQPNVSFFKNTEARLPRKYSGIIGWSKKLNEWNLNPTLEFNSIGSSNSLSVCLNASWKNINAGVKYRLGNQVGFAAGYDIAGKVRLAYAYSITTSSLGTQTLGSHFFSVRCWLFKNKRTEYRLLDELGIL